MCLCADVWGCGGVGVSNVAVALLRRWSDYQADRSSSVPAMRICTSRLAKRMASLYATSASANRLARKNAFPSARYLLTCAWTDPWAGGGEEG
eukprot:391613-Prorocentrum_minimum.AAC.3